MKIIIFEPNVIFRMLGKVDQNADDFIVNLKISLMVFRG